MKGAKEEAIVETLELINVVSWSGRLFGDLTLIWSEVGFVRMMEPNFRN